MILLLSCGAFSLVARGDKKDDPTDNSDGDTASAASTGELHYREADGTLQKSPP